MGHLLTWASITSLFGIGAGAVIAPALLAQNYGLPIGDDPTARNYIRALGARDATLGLVALTFALRREREPLRTTLFLSSLLAVSDFGIVATFRGASGWKSLALHGSGFVALVAAALAET